MPEQARVPYDEGRIRAKLQKWKERLLDLSRGNPLLGINRSRVTKLRVTAPDQHALFARFVIDEEVLRLPFIRKVTRQVEGEQEPIAEWQRTPGDIDFDGTSEDLARKVRRIYDNARTTVEERGVTTLYLTFGLLEWDDPNLGKSQTPLWMVPCQLERTGSAAPLKLSKADEEVQLNPALVLYLRERHKLELPPIPEDPQPESLGEHLGATASVVRETDWSVKDGVWLSTYSFESLVLYQDLTAMADQALLNPLIAAMAKAGGEPEGSEALGDDLDQLTVERIPLPVIQTDSSQFEALAQAVSGRHLVVHGPPGTGKSQTITALIADALGRGKKVLFVSAKMAALEVVHRRLQECGLADLCLEAHSTKAGKAKIIEELRRTLDADLPRGNGKLEDEHEQLSRIRDQLNEYVRALHERVEPLGLTPFQGIGRFARLRGAPEVRFALPWGEVLQVTRGQLGDILELVDDLAGQGDSFDGRATHPWRGLVLGTGGVAEREAVEAELVELRRAALSVTKAAASLGVTEAALTFSALDGDLEALETYAGTDELPVDWRTRPADRLVGAAVLLEKAATTTAEMERQLEAHHAVTERAPEHLLDLLRPLDDRFRSWFSRLMPAYWRWIREVRTQLRPETRSGYADLVSYRARAHRCLELRTALEAQADAIAAELGPGRAGDRAALERAARSARAAVVLRAARLDLRSLPDPGDAVQQAARALVADLPARSPRVSAALDRVAAWWPSGFGGQGSLRETPIAAVIERCDGILGSGRKMDEWVLLQRTLTRCRDAGMGPFIDALGEHSARDGRRVFERRFFNLWTSDAIQRSPVLESFLGARREDLVRRFRELDEKIRISATRHVRSVAGEPARRIRTADPSMGAASEVGILRLELGKRKRLKPLRKLFDQIPNVLQALKPCMLMSPISVSTYLKPGSVTFDLVVFDEASQLPTQEAVPAILRAEQVVVAGDAKQLPPTTFFMSTFLSGEEDADDEEEASLEPLESLLDDAGAIIPHFGEARLRWHYRSRDERLIAFSNRFFYEDRLHTFPSATTASDGRGVEAIYVADGVYGRGKDRRNPREARRVAEVVVDQLERYPDRSIGVVALNISQKEAIDDTIREELAERPDLAALWDRDSEEPHFVKALEQVQGDERDTMIISVGYGRDADGALTYNFGPINVQGGERRLNVLVTRAKWHTIIVTSLRSTELSGINPNNKGASHLRDYIAYAESGGVLPRPPATDTDGETNDFEDAVREALIERGLDVDAQVGAGRYRIDLAIRDRRDPQRYVLGIECDGVTYHASKTARDRDLLRHNVLRDMGWRIHRLWSAEWFRDPDAAIAQVLRSLEQAEAAAVSASVEAPKRRLLDLLAVPETDVAVPVPAASTPARYPGGVPYVRYKGPPQPREHLLSSGHTANLAVTVGRVVSVESPLTEEVLIERLRAVHYGVRRAGDNIRGNVRHAVKYARSLYEVEVRQSHGEHVIAKKGSRLATFRTPADGVKRAIDEIPHEEVELAVLHLVEQQFSVQRDAIPHEVAELFGFERAGTTSADRVRDVVDGLVEQGRLRASGPNVALA